LQYSSANHFGSGDLTHQRERSVFINCPFDATFLQQFDAIVFATICCGFMPRCSFESGTMADSRMDRIIGAIHSSKYSIHDLSKCKGEGDLNLSRFNMPLELGIAMSERFRQIDSADSHDWVALVPEGHVYQKVISDLNGYDPYEYDGSVDSLVAKIMGWLATRLDAPHTTTPKAVIASLPEYEARLLKVREHWAADRPPWTQQLVCCLEVATGRGLIPKVA
jgi:hypothetical protein